MNSKSLLSKENAILFVLIAIKLAIHFSTNDQYGFHRDELYYIDCGENLDWGFVDHPPFTPAAANFARALFGDSLFAIRLFPAMAGAGIVLVTILMVRQFSGGRFAQLLGGLAVILAPRYLHSNGMLQAVSFDQFFSVLAAYFIIRTIKSGDSRLWLAVGAIAGIGLMNKHTMLFFLFGALIGLLAAPQRKMLADKWFSGGAALASMIFLPNVLWQIKHDWPTLEFLQFINAEKMQTISFFDFFVIGQIGSQQIFAFPIWLAGLWFFLFTEKGRPYKVFGVAYLTILLLFLIIKAKPYYLGPIYPVLFAGGAVWLGEKIGKSLWVRGSLAIVFVAGSILVMPKTALPIYPVEQTTSGDYKDMVGWDEMVAAVSEAFQTLTPEEQADCIVFTGNYGQAGAINFLGRNAGLPKAISGHNSHWIWGPGEEMKSVAIVLGADSAANLLRYYESVQEAGVIRNKYGVENEEHNRPLFICRNPKISFQQAWPRLKHYD